jgi:hypothetical protein
VEPFEFDGAMLPLGSVEEAHEAERIVDVAGDQRTGQTVAAGALRAGPHGERADSVCPTSGRAADGHLGALP